MRRVIPTTLAAACLLTLAACGPKPEPAPAASNTPRTVTVVRVEARPLAGGLTASGALVSREEAAVNSELAGYRVARVLVEAGARVARGQPLAQLDDTLLRSQIDQQKALLAQQQVVAEQADSQARHVAGLDDQGVLSTEQIEQRRFEARRARAAADAQAAVLKDLQTREGRMVIRAPVGGLVLERNVRPGDLSTPGEHPMFRMARDNLVELEAQVAEAALGGIRAGDTVQVSLPNGQSVAGSVRLVNPSVDPQTKLGTVRVRLPVRPDLRPGGFGRASFTGTSRTVSVVPETAVRYDADGASVMMVGADNRVHEVQIRTGERAGGMVELVSGPPAGSRVLLRAAAFVLQGDPVKPVEAR